MKYNFVYLSKKTGLATRWNVEVLELCQVGQPDKKSNTPRLSVLI